MRGFVLIELLVVLAILSVVFFYLTPISVNIFKTTDNSGLNGINSIVKAASAEAKKTGFAQYIWGEKGSNRLHFGKKSVTLPADVLSVRVNKRYQEGLEYRFRVYPCGIMDKVEIDLYGGKKLISVPLLARFSLGE